MPKNPADILMNPARQRIIQYFVLHKKGTSGQLAEALPDIPRASLYRHIKMLYDAGYLQVLETHPVRGTEEKTYCLTAQPMGENASEKEVSALIQNLLYAVMTSFAQYFQTHDTADAQKDLLSVSSCTLLLTDDEFAELLRRIGQVYQTYLNNKPSAGRKERCLTFISAPSKPSKGESPC